MGIWYCMQDNVSGRFRSNRLPRTTLYVNFRISVLGTRCSKKAWPLPRYAPRLRLRNHHSSCFDASPLGSFILLAPCQQSLAEPCLTMALGHLTDSGLNTIVALSLKHPIQLRSFIARSGGMHVLSRSTFLQQRRYATSNTLSGSKESSRKQVTVRSDDGRVQWSDLTTGEKAARTTQQTFNFGVILLGFGMTVGGCWNVNQSLLKYDRLELPTYCTPKFLRQTARLGTSTVLLIGSEPMPVP